MRGCLICLVSSFFKKEGDSVAWKVPCTPVCFLCHVTHHSASFIYSAPVPFCLGIYVGDSMRKNPTVKASCGICPPVVQAAWESKTQDLMNQCVWENNKCQNNNRIIFLKMYMSIIYAYECFAKTLCAWCLGRSEESIRSLETGVLDAYKLLCECGEQNPGPLLQQPVLFSTEPLLHPSNHHILLCNFPGSSDLLVHPPRSVLSNC